MNTDGHGFTRETVRFMLIKFAASATQLLELLRRPEMVRAE